MKIKANKILAVVLVLMISMLLPLTAFASVSPDFDSRFKLQGTDYPEGTFYIDLLVEMDQNDSNYTAFNENMKDNSYMNKDFQIASYNEEGYVSFSMHNKLCESFILDDGRVSSSLKVSDITCNDLFRKYKIKAAYVDKDGNVLGVTDTAKSVSDSNGYSFTAKGSELVYNSDNSSHGEISISILSVVVFSVLAVALVIGIVYLVYTIKKSKKTGG